MKFNDHGKYLEDVGDVCKTCGKIEVYCPGYCNDIDMDLCYDCWKAHCESTHDMRNRSR